jgi:hypothetical protein
LRSHLGLFLMIPHHYLTAAYLLVPRTHRLLHISSLMIILMHLPLALMMSDFSEFPDDDDHETQPADSWEPVSLFNTLQAHPTYKPRRSGRQRKPNSRYGPTGHCCSKAPQCLLST